MLGAHSILARLSGETEDSSAESSEESDDGEDIVDESENVSIRCLCCNTTFDAVALMLQHCEETHQFSLVHTKEKLRLGFLGVVKLINFIRSHALTGRPCPDISTRAAFEDEHYLQPVLEDDALLYSLEDVIDFEDIEEGLESVTTVSHRELSSIENNEKHLAFKQLDEDNRVWYDLQASEEELSDSDSDTARMKLHPSMTGDDSDVKDDVTLPEKMIPMAIGRAEMSREGDGAVANVGTESDESAAVINYVDSAYFASYSAQIIHELMLKDTVRTEAYRDFIYHNKELITGKVVLDVGCGTGILSMFCARAGAAKVIAVEYSDIINIARENVYKNGMGEIITCVRGRIEEVTLPVKEVDIIVSEWMGYCLLYEAMLDSVIWARDRYLSSSGLMIPSHITLRIAPISDSELMQSNVHMWENVYGFDMTSMYTDVFRNIRIMEVPESAIPAGSSPFLQLDLKTVTTDSLIFANRPFSCELQADIDGLDAFVIWFDTFFLPTPHGQIPADAKAENWASTGDNSVAFTTGPHGESTHWQQCVLLIDHTKKEPMPLRKGQIIDGRIGYAKMIRNPRALIVKAGWQVWGSEEQGQQAWRLE